MSADQRRSPRLSVAQLQLANGGLAQPGDSSTIAAYLLPCLLLVSGCGPDAPTRPGVDGAATRLAWAQTTVTSVGRPALDSANVYFLGRSNEVAAVRRSDGSVVWRTTLPSGTPKTDGNSVVVAGGHILAGDGNIFALDPVSGAVRWQFTPSEGRGPGRWIMTSRGDTLVTGSSSGHVYAIDATTGREIWRVRLPDSLAAPHLTTDVFDPTIDGPSAFAAFTERLPTYPFLRGGLVAVELRTGRILWARRTPQAYAGDDRTGTFGIAVSGEVVAAWTISGYVYGFNRTDAEVRWVLLPDPATPAWNGRPGEDLRPLAVESGRILVGSGVGWITAVDAASGRQLWRSNATFGGTGSYLWAHRSTVYAMDLMGRVAALDAATGAPRWRLDDPAARTAVGMAFEGDHWYAGGGAGVFAALR